MLRVKVTEAGGICKCFQKARETEKQKSGLRNISKHRSAFWGQCDAVIGLRNLQNNLVCKQLETDRVQEATCGPHGHRAAYNGTTQQ